jgi:hypothetical protein
MTSKQATIVPSDNGFAVVVDGNVVRAGFTSRGMAAMWAARQKLYRGTTRRHAKPVIPPALEDQSIKPTRLLAAMTGESHWRFMVEARRGTYGPLFRLGSKGYGLGYGNWKRGLAARAINPPTSDAP